MTPFRETDDAADFIATADSRETSPEVMKAIVFFARDLAEAEAIWEGNLENICDVSDLWENATNNGKLPDSETLFWGGKPLSVMLTDLLLLY